MGTRGFITFVADKAEKTTYNHWDSYPSGLGADVLTWLRAASDSLEAVRDRIAALKVIGEGDKPTAEDVERLAPYIDLSVSNRSTEDWYCLLRGTQGNPHAILDGGVIQDASEFPMDSFFAEYGYVIDLDAEVFEVYEGFQEQPHTRGRFADRTPLNHSVGTYYPVALVKSWPLSALPSDEEFAAAFSEEDE